MPALIKWQPLASVATTEAGGSTTLGARFRKATEEKKLPSLLIGNKSVHIHQMPSEQGFRLSEIPTSVRPKQVKDRLIEATTARLCGVPLPVEKTFHDYSTYRNEHEPNSVCLGAMVLEFMENEAGVGKWGRHHLNYCGRNCITETCSRCYDDESEARFGLELSDTLQGIVPCASNVERTMLAEVKSVVDLTYEDISVRGNVNGKNCTSADRMLVVMRHLRKAGYDAAVCKSRWDHTAELPAGDYEYIDALVEGERGTPERVIVDVDFRAQFEIARPTSCYLSVLQVLPSIFVGKLDRLQKILNVMSDAAKQSLQKNGLHLPPWRTPNYMMAKWFSSYKRITNGSVCSHSSYGGTIGKEIVDIALRGCGRYAKYIELKKFHNGADAKWGEGEMNENIIGMAENVVQSEKDEFIVKSSDWKPPTVNARQSQKPGKSAGLASLLLQAGLVVKASPDHQMHHCSKGELALVA